MSKQPIGQRIRCWLQDNWGVATFFGVCIAANVILALIAGELPPGRGGVECYIDWDGRSNPTVCD